MVKKSSILSVSDGSGNKTTLVTPIPAQPILKIGKYLSSISPLLTEAGLSFVLAKRGLSGTENISELDEKSLDLAEAEVYYWLSNLPVGGSTVKDVDGNYSHSEGGWQVSKANIEEWRRKYTSLREKWGEAVITKTRIRLINL